MKKNITINLFGTLYNIDEDAYQLLDNYLQSMKRYFSTKDGGEQVYVNVLFHCSMFCGFFNLVVLLLSS